MWFLIAVITALLGSGLHFLYEILPTPLTALISPINESVWEHLKLLFWPTLLGALFLSRRAKEKPRFWASVFASLLGAPTLLLVVFYSLKALGVESIVLDISLYFLCMFLGFWLIRFLYRKAKAEKAGGFLLMLVILYGAALILFTFAAPDLPIFRKASPTFGTLSLF